MKFEILKIVTAQDEEEREEIEALIELVRKQLELDEKIIALRRMMFIKD
jgi:hypothetical protein